MRPKDRTKLGKHIQYVFRSCNHCGRQVHLRLTEQGFVAYDDGAVKHLCRRRKDHPDQQWLPLGDPRM